MFRFAEGACDVDSEALHKLELDEPGGVAIESLAVQHLVLSSNASRFLYLLTQCSFFGGRTDSAGKARQGRAIQALFRMYMNGT